MNVAARHSAVLNSSYLVETVTPEPLLLVPVVETVVYEAWSRA